MSQSRGSGYSSSKFQKDVHKYKILGTEDEDYEDEDEDEDYEDEDEDSRSQDLDFIVTKISKPRKINFIQWLNPLRLLALPFSVLFTFFYTVGYIFQVSDIGLKNAWSRIRHTAHSIFRAFDQLAQKVTSIAFGLVDLIIRGIGFLAAAIFDSLNLWCKGGQFRLRQHSKDLRKEIGEKLTDSKKISIVRSLLLMCFRIFILPFAPLKAFVNLVLGIALGRSYANEQLFRAQQPIKTVENNARMAAGSLVLALPLVSLMLIPGIGFIIGSVVVVFGWIVSASILSVMKINHNKNILVGDGDVVLYNQKGVLDYQLNNKIEVFNRQCDLEKELKQARIEGNVEKEEQVLEQMQSSIVLSDSKHILQQSLTAEQKIIFGASQMHSRNLNTGDEYPVVNKALPLAIYDIMADCAIKNMIYNGEIDENDLQTIIQDTFQSMYTYTGTNEEELMRLECYGQMTSNPVVLSICKTGLKQIEESGIDIYAKGFGDKVTCGFNGKGEVISLNFNCQDKNGDPIAFYNQNLYDGSIHTVDLPMIDRTQMQVAIQDSNQQIMKKLKSAGICKSNIRYSDLLLYIETQANLQFNERLMQQIIRKNNSSQSLENDLDTLVGRFVNFLTPSATISNHPSLEKDLIRAFVVTTIMIPMLQNVFAQQSQWNDKSPETLIRLCCEQLLQDWSKQAYVYLKSKNARKSPSKWWDRAKPFKRCSTRDMLRALSIEPLDISSVPQELSKSENLEIIWNESRTKQLFNRVLKKNVATQSVGQLNYKDNTYILQKELMTIENQSYFVYQSPQHTLEWTHGGHNFPLQEVMLVKVPSQEQNLSFTVIEQSNDSTNARIQIGGKEFRLQSCLSLSGTDKYHRFVADDGDVALIKNEGIDFTQEQGSQVSASGIMINDKNPLIVNNNDVKKALAMKVPNDQQKFFVKSQTNVAADERQQTGSNRAKKSRVVAYKSIGDQNDRISIHYLPNTTTPQVNYWHKFDNTETGFGVGSQLLYTSPTGTQPLLVPENPANLDSTRIPLNMPALVHPKDANADVLQVKSATFSQNKNKYEIRKQKYVSVGGDMEHSKFVTHSSKYNTRKVDKTFEEMQVSGNCKQQLKQPLLISNDSKKLGTPHWIPFIQLNPVIANNPAVQITLPIGLTKRNVDDVEWEGTALIATELIQLSNNQSYKVKWSCDVGGNTVEFEANLTRRDNQVVLMNVENAKLKDNSSNEINLQPTDSLVLEAQANLLTECAANNQQQLKVMYEQNRTLSHDRKFEHPQQSMLCVQKYDISTPAEALQDAKIQHHFHANLIASMKKDAQNKVQFQKDFTIEFPKDDQNCPRITNYSILYRIGTNHKNYRTFDNLSAHISDSQNIQQVSPHNVAAITDVHNWGFAIQSSAVDGNLVMKFDNQVIEVGVVQFRKNGSIEEIKIDHKKMNQVLSGIHPTITQKILAQKIADKMSGCVQNINNNNNQVNVKIGYTKKIKEIQL